MNCSTCKWWNEQGHSANILGRLIPADHKDAAKVGECRANPPFPVKGDATNWRMFPSTLAKDWCGDYEAKPVQAAPVLPPAPKPAPVPVAAPAPDTGFVAEFKRRVGRPRKDT